MKTLTVIVSFLFCTSCISQVVIDSSTLYRDTTLKQFVIGDRIISCSDCKVDFCGNVVNSTGDTIGKNARSLNSDGSPLYFTTDNILLPQKTIKALLDRKKVKSVNVIKCNEGQRIFKDLAKNGIVLLELQDTTIKTENLLEFLNRTITDKNILVTDILINGLATRDKKIKYPKWDKLVLGYDSKKKVYNIKTE